MASVRKSKDNKDCVIQSAITLSLVELEYPLHNSLLYRVYRKPDYVQISVKTLCFVWVISKLVEPFSRRSIKKKGKFDFAGFFCCLWSDQNKKKNKQCTFPFYIQAENPVLQTRPWCQFARVRVCIYRDL